MALDSCNELQRIYDIDFGPRHGERIYRKRILVPTLSVVVGDLIGIETLQPELDEVFKFFPYHVQDMSHDRHPGIYSRGLHAVLSDLGVDTVEVVQEGGY